MNINNIKVSGRLGIGFGIVLLLMFIMGISGWLFTKHNVQSVDQMLDKDLRKERLVSEWLTLTNRNIGVSIAAISTANAVQRQKILDSVTADSAQITTITKTVKPLLRFKKGQDIFHNIEDMRGKYTALRMTGLKMAERGENSFAIQDFIANQYLPASDNYRQSLISLLNFQKELIDNAHRDVLRTSSQTEWLMILVSLIGIVAGSLIAWVITRSITAPLREAVEVASHVAKGDLTVSISTPSQDELGQLLRSLQEMIASLDGIVRNVRSGAESITLAADEIDTGNQDLASRTEQQAASVEETAATLEQLTSTIKSTASNTEQMNVLFTQAGSVVTANTNRMHAVSESMDEIHHASEKMTDIITVIEGIAFQTNILALNAAVEAARAGEQGRGFAVVAGEVRTLAQRSSASAREIRDIINLSVSKIAEGRDLVNDADSGMQNMVNNITQLQQLVEEITHASHEQSDGIAQINLAMGQIDTTTQQNAALVEESSAASASLKGQSAILADNIQVFTLSGHENKSSARLPMKTSVKPQLQLADSRSAEEQNWETF